MEINKITNILSTTNKIISPKTQNTVTTQDGQKLLLSLEGLAKRNCLTTVGKDTITKDKPINLFHYLKKRLYSTNELNQVVLSTKNRFLGSLPKNWIEKFSEDGIKDKTLMIDEIFSNFAIQSYSKSTKNIQELKPQIDKLKNELEQILNSECKVEFIDSGVFGKVFKVSIDNEDFALKIFHSDPPAHLVHSHGRTKEIANAIYLNKQLKPNQCSKFYFGKIAADNIEDGYMVTKFVQDNKKPKTPQPFVRHQYSRFYLGDKEKSGNLTNGMIVDYGAVSMNYKNRNHQKYAKELFPLLNKGDVQAVKEFVNKHQNSNEFKDFFEFFKRKMKIFTQPIRFFNDLNSYTKNQIDSYRALGLDFSKIENFDYSTVPNEIINNLLELGFRIKK